MLYALIALAIGVSFVSLVNKFPLIKFGASVMWLGVLAYIVGNYSGENWTVIAILGCIVMMVALPLSQLGRDISRSQDQSGAYTISSSGFSFKLPDWLKGGETPQAKQRKQEESNEEYREKIHRALHPPRRKR